MNRFYVVENRESQIRTKNFFYDTLDGFKIELNILYVCSGHHSSYALLLYGDQFNKDGDREINKRSAEMIKNVLKHKNICGIP